MHFRLAKQQQQHFRLAKQQQQHFSLAKQQQQHFRLAKQQQQCKFQWKLLIHFRLHLSLLYPMKSILQQQLKHFIHYRESPS
jgi:hypothetical protein